MITIFIPNRNFIWLNSLYSLMYRNTYHVTFFTLLSTFRYHNFVFLYICHRHYCPYCWTEKSTVTSLFQDSSFIEVEKKSSSSHRSTSLKKNHLQVSDQLRWKKIIFKSTFNFVEQKSSSSQRSTSLKNNHLQVNFDRSWKGINCSSFRCSIHWLWELFIVQSWLIIWTLTNWTFKVEHWLLKVEQEVEKCEFLFRTCLSPVLWIVRENSCFVRINYFGKTLGNYRKSKRCPQIM